MMQKRLFTIWTGAMLAVAAFFAGCSDTMDDDRLEQETMAGNIYLRLRMNRAGNGIPDGSRSIARTGEETPETDDENAIHRMDLLVYNIDDAAGEPLLSDVVSLDEAQIKEITSEEGVLVPLYIQNEKRLRIYAAANLTDEMRERFILKQTTPEVSISFPSANDYGSVINKFVPGSNGSSEGLGQAGSATGIPMTGQFLLSVPASEGGIASATQGDLQTILVDPEKMTQEHPLDIETEMVRMVAKIHVQAMAEEETQGEDGTAYYVSATPEGGTSAFDRIGWIRLDNVKYLPNGINKSTYFFPQPAKGGTISPWKDLNMGWEYYDPKKTEPTDWENDFCFYNNEKLHEENVSGSSHFAQAGRYVESLSGANDNPNPDGGMYCPENYFDAPDLSLGTKLNNDKKGIPMVTHVSIAAKLTPQSIVVPADFEAKMDELVDSYEAEENKDKFYQEYGLEKEDFTGKDATRWKEIKPIYFTGTNGETLRNGSRIIETTKEADAVDLLDWSSLKSNKLWSRNDNPESGKYPSGTFFVYDTTQRDKNGQPAVPIEADTDARYLYFSVGAFNEIVDDAEKKYFELHSGGWGYYYTYLSKESTDEDTDGQTPYTSSQVTRNAYYLVTIKNFGTPGSGIAP